MSKQISWFKIMVAQIGLSMTLWGTGMTQDEYFDSIRKSENRRNKLVNKFVKGTGNLEKVIPNKELPFGD